jgi:cytochrome c556
MRTAVVAVAILALVFVVSLGSAEDTKDKAKHTIKEVMKIAHKDGLLKKVTKGEASKDEQKQLVELYKDLAKNTPPKGDPELWKKNTARMVALAEAVVNGDEKAAKTLAKTVNCGACHKEFKGK